MPLDDTNNINSYYNLLSNLNDNSKIELIAQLSKSILEQKKDKKKSLEKLFGAWKSNESAEEIIDKLRKSRVTNRKTESF